MNDSVTHRTPDPRDASASENFNAEWSFMDFYILNDYIEQ